MATPLYELRGAWEEASRIEEEALDLFLNATTLRESVVLAPLLEFAARTRRELWDRLMLGYLNPVQPAAPRWCE